MTNNPTEIIAGFSESLASSFRALSDAWEAMKNAQHPDLATFAKGDIILTEAAKRVHLDHANKATGHLSTIKDIYSDFATQVGDKSAHATFTNTLKDSGLESSFHDVVKLAHPDHANFWNGLRSPPSSIKSWVNRTVSQAKQNAHDNISDKGSWFMKIARVSVLVPAITTAGSGFINLVNALTADSEQLDKLKIKRRNIIFSSVATITFGAALGVGAVCFLNDAKMSQGRVGGMHV